MKCERLINLNSAWVTAADSADYDSDNTGWSNEAHDRNHWHWTTATNYQSVNEDLKIGHLSCELVKIFFQEAECIMHNFQLTLQT